MKFNINATFLFFLFTIPLLCYSQKKDYWFYQYKNENGWGIKYNNGEKLFEKTFDSLFTTYKSRILAKKDDYWGVIDSLGNELIPFKYSEIDIDEFGYNVGRMRNIGFLSLKGDTLVPFDDQFIYSIAIGEKGDFLLLVSNDSDINAIYSSDGVQRTDFEYLQVTGIDSAAFFKSPTIHPYYFGLESVEKKYGVYDGINKKIVVQPEYYDVCVSWCGIAENPHLRKSSILYVGEDPFFMMEKDGRPVVIKNDGEILFESDSISNVDFKTRYYLFDNGSLSQVEGKCVEKRDYPPPYVMQDEKGYFLVNKDGSYFEKTKVYHDLISKINYELNSKETIFFIVTDNNKVGLMNDSGEWILKPEYEHIAYYKDNRTDYLEVRKKNEKTKYYSKEFQVISSEPRKPYLLPNVHKKDTLFGVMDVDSTWLIPAIYKSLEILYKQSYHDGKYKNIIKGYLFEGEQGFVDLFDNNFEKIERFEASEFLTSNGVNIISDNYQYLFLYDEQVLSLFDFDNKRYVIKEKPFKPLRQFKDANSQVIKGDIYFYLRDFSDNLHVIDSMGKTIFISPLKSELDVSPSLIKAGDLLVLKKIYYDKDRKLVSVHYQSSTGKTIDKNKSEIGENYYHFYHEKTQTFFFKTHYKSKIIEVYDRHFNLLNTLEGEVKLYEDFYILSNKEQDLAKVYTSQDSVALTLKNKYFDRLEHGSGVYSKLDTSYILLNEFTLLSPLKYYPHPPYYLDKKGLIMMLKNYYERPYKYDVFHPSGKLILEDYEFTKRSRSYSGKNYFVFENEVEEIWLTEEGIIYHKNVK